MRSLKLCRHRQNRELANAVMRIGMIVDGQAEFRSLPKMFSRINTRSTLIRPLYADIQPKARPEKIVRAIWPSVHVLARKQVRHILVLLDHERRSECVPNWRDTLESALSDKCGGMGIENIKVVMKVQMYENWLVSDPTAVRKKMARFSLSEAHVKKVSPNKADHADAIKILKEAAQGSSYAKIKDAVGIMEKFDPYVGAANSRSFRRF